MANTRRAFLQSSAALAAGLASPATPADAQKNTQVAPVQVPKMKFFNAEISRLVLGVNTFYGYAHFNPNFSASMKEWYTQDRVCQVMHQANRYGINAFNYVDKDRARSDWSHFQAEGGKMHLIIQVTADDDAAALVRDLKPLALQRQGEVTDKAFRNGQLNTVREWCKKVRDLGVLVGVGTHKPEVIAQIEEEGWDVDFYSGCVYNRTRTPDEWKKVLNGEMMELPNDIYMQSDPPRMYRAIRQTRKPCFAFKILAAGRIPEKGIEQAFRTAFESIKPIDAVYVGMFPRIKDEVREDAEIVHRILTRA
jgi:thiamine monophosphate synthase